MKNTESPSLGSGVLMSELGTCKEIAPAAGVAPSCRMPVR